ncbi:hypothetical protein KKB83_05700 [Patescibacteria group bacterium]|nr:hypothetical protein [Patescibacteria group bacterium]
MSKWIAGHQPVLDFHTGLLAKLWVVSRRDGFPPTRGTLLLHDLDTLQERGSRTIQIPNPRGQNTKGIRLVRGRIQPDQLFTAGPVVCGDWDDVRRALVTLADGEKGLYKLSDRRIRALRRAFPPSRKFKDVAELNIALLRFILPRIGIPVPRIVRLSDLLGQRNWQRNILTVLKDLNSWGNAIRRADGRVSSIPFWAWDKQEQKRLPVGSVSQALILAQRGQLIPQAAPLVYIVRCRLKRPMVRGTGGAKYEKPLERAARQQRWRIARAVTITSTQGCPAAWLSPKGFRPSALLLWLMGGNFDPRQIERS